MLRFFSRRKPRGRADQKGYYQQQQLEKERALQGVKKKRDKNQLPCRIILLDGADLSIDIQVSTKKKNNTELFFKIVYSRGRM